MLHLAKNIKWIRLLSGKKQTEFAVILGITDDQLYTYESGKAKPNSVVKGKIATIAGITIEDLENTDIKKQTVQVINPDTKKVEFTLAPNGANQHEKELKHLQEMLAEKEKQIKLLTQLLEKTSKKS